MKKCSQWLYQLSKRVSLILKQRQPSITASSYSTKIGNKIANRNEIHYQDALMKGKTGQIDGLVVLQRV